MKKKHNVNMAGASKLRKLMLFGISIIVAAALVVTGILCLSPSKRSPSDEVDNGGVETSAVTTFDAKTKWGRTVDLATNIYNGSVKKGDIVNFAFIAQGASSGPTGARNNNGFYPWNNGIYTVTLPQGTYKLEVWGAQGGGRSGVDANGAGGYGGYSSATLTLTTKTTIYVVVGGAGEKGGTYRCAARGFGYGGGGYNGGGNVMAGGGSIPTAATGGGGGGATHIATANGLLSALNGNKNAVLLVAGGGGGGHHDAYAYGGNAGGTYGASSVHINTNYDPYVYGQGGTQTAGGAVSAGTTTANGDTTTSATAGGFGAGGRGGSWGNGGGGGGGGWYGGSGGYIQGGGGGSGHIGTDSRLSNGRMIAGGSSNQNPLNYDNKNSAPSFSTSIPNPTGSGNIKGQLDNGFAKITVVNCNDVPVTQNKEFAASVRQNNLGLEITTSAIASDPENKAMFFSNGTTTSIDTVTPSGFKLYLDAAHTKVASDYVSWTLLADNKIRIDEIKRYPRAGVDGIATNGKLKLYAWVRDSFATTAERGYSLIPFTLNVTDNAIYAVDASNVDNTATHAAAGTGDGTYKKVNDDALGNYVEYTYGSDAKLYNYRVGLSDSIDTAYDYVHKGHIYNTATGKKTVFIPQALSPSRATDGFVIHAADVFGDADDKNKGYDIVGIKEVSTDASASAYYTITYNDNASVFDPTSHLVDSITIKPTNQRPSGAVFVSVVITAQSYEKASRKTIGSEFKEVSLVFRIANTRPLYATADDAPAGLNEPLVTLKVGETQTLDQAFLSSFLHDPDASSPTYTFATTDGIKIPTHEYIAVNRENALIALTSSLFPSNSLNNDANIEADSWQTGEGKVLTGFKPRTLAMQGSAAASQACITYSYDVSGNLVLTGRAATQYQYSSPTRVNDRESDLYIMVRVIDSGDAGDDGIWFPIPIRVTPTEATDLNPSASFTLSFHDYKEQTSTDDASTTLNGDENNPDSIILTPLGYTMSDGTVKGIGAGSQQVANASDHIYSPFVYDADAFSYGDDTNYFDRELNDVVAVKVSDPVNYHNTEQFVRVELVDMYVQDSVVKGLTSAQLSMLGITQVPATTVYTFKGVKLIPLRATDNYYYRVGINIVDSHGTESEVGVYVKIENRSINNRTSRTDSADTRATKYPISTAYGGRYVQNALTGATSVNYIMEKGQTIRLTPYDFAYDFDTASEKDIVVNDGVADMDFDAWQGYLSNTNPSQNGFAATQSLILKKYNVTRKAAPNAAPEVKDVTTGLLTFSDVSVFNNAVLNHSGYIEGGIRLGDSETLPFIELTAKGRTSASEIMLSFTVTDGYSSITCTIAITIENAAPALKDDLPSHYTLHAVPHLGTSELQVNAYEFALGDLAYDIDGDSIEYVPGTVRVVGKGTDGKFYTGILYDPATGAYGALTDDDSAVAGSGLQVIKFSSFFTAVLGKNSNGQDVIRIEAKSSTQLLPCEVHFQFTAIDSYRAQPKEATLSKQVEVLNSDPEFLNDDLTQIGTGSDLHNTWYVNAQTDAAVKATRYIINSKELYDSAVIPASPANKLLLFSEPDAMQTVLLNPTGSYPSKTDDLVEKLASGSMLGSAPKTSAAVTYISPYADNADGTNDFSIKVQYYEKGNDGTFTPAMDRAIENGKYWALIIKDNRTEKPTVHLSIAYKDETHGKDLYNGGRDATVEIGDTDVYQTNLYIAYQPRGLDIMHEKYRTDGNAEANVMISDGMYQVDLNQSNLQAAHFADKTKPTTQEGLRTAKFAESFRNLYFINLKGAGEVSKYFPENAFPYDPVEISGGDATDNPNTTVKMPVSYMAMPSGELTKSTKTGEGTYVTLGNAIYMTSDPNDENDQKAKFDPDKNLEDASYYDWGKNNLDLVFENVSLQFGDKVYSGATLNDNPYIEIGYTAVPEGTHDIGGDYVNDQRYMFASSGVTKLPNDVSFREDKFGFTFTRKKGQPRPTGNLKFTVMLRAVTVAEESGRKKISHSTQQEVTVELNVRDAAPAINEIEFGFASFGLEMTTSLINGKYVELVRDDEKNSQLLKQPGITYTDVKTLIFEDNDSNDVMKFLMASATSGKLSDSMTTAEIEYFIKSSCVGGALGLAEYFRTDSNTANNLTYDFAADYVPNPNFETFFTVTPGTGAASSIQIKPNAKTQLNFAAGMSDADKDAYLEANNLQADLNGDGKKNYGSIYYPYRIICFDDLGDMGLTNAMWYPVTIKVYIVNDELTLADGVEELKSPLNGTSEKIGDGLYPFSVGYSTSSTAQNKYTVDVARLLSDNDMVTKTKGSYNVPVVEADREWQDVVSSTGTDKKIYSDKTGGVTTTYNFALVKDYLVMPAMTGNVPAHDVTAGNITVNGTTECPVSVTVDTTADATTLIFTTNRAFKNPVRMRFEFADSVGTKQAIVFVISYTNAAPKVHPDTYSGTETLNIVMKTGDSFTLFATEYDQNKFDNDRKGGFGSPDEFERAKNDVNNQMHSYPMDNAQSLKSKFEFYVMDTTGGGTAYPDNRTPGSLGSLIVGDDDAPSTLRFVQNNSGVPVGMFIDPSNIYNFSVKAGHMLSREGSANGNNAQPMSVTIEATGVVTNAEYRFTLVDDQNNTKELIVYITVLSSKPTAKPVDNNKYNGFDVTYSNVNNKDEYDIELEYGDEFAIPLSAFMDDKDGNDRDGFYLPAIYDNSPFKIVNPTGTPRAVSVSQGKIGTLNSLVIEATDFIDKDGEKTTVTFRVSDMHGAQSDEITFNVTIKPRNVKLVADNRENAVKATIPSYQAFVGGTSPVTVDLVSAVEKGAVVFDPDSTAPSALYNAEVYALNSTTTDTDGNVIVDTIEPNEVTDASMIARCIQPDGTNPGENGAGPDTGAGSVYEYVCKFFTISISEDGKRMTLTPNSATIDKSEKFDSPIELYIKISKCYESSGSFSMPEVGAHVHASVDNSDPLAVKSSSVNYGYGLQEVVGDDGTKTYVETTRREQFLSFTGSSGDEMIWYLYNKDNRNRGLFYDYDMINTGFDGSDKLRFISAEVLDKNVDGMDVSADAKKLTSTMVNGKELQPVFSISPVNDNMVKIKINRKVRFSQTAGSQSAPAYTDVTIRLYVADSLNYYSTEGKKFTTDIYVRIDNDAPEFKTVATEENKGYTLTYSAIEGYQMTASVKTGETLNVNLADILDDKDIRFDAYYFHSTGDSNCLTNDTTAIFGRRYGTDSGDSELFAFSVVNGQSDFEIQTMTGFRFKCTSTNRGAIGVCVLQLQDSTKQQSAMTSRLTIYLTVGNTAPTAKTDNVVIDVMGVRLGGDASAPAGTFNIIDFVNDINPNDIVDATVEGNTSDTYVYIDAINIYQRGNGVEEPIIYGDGVIDEPTIDPDDPMGGGTPATMQVCNINWADNDTHQSFHIGLTPGVYGTQKAVLTVMDSGYLDGQASGVTDGIAYQLNITIIVSRPLDDFDIPTFDIARKVTREVTPELLLNSGEGEHNADGYIIKDIASETSSVTPSSKTEGEASAASVSASAASDTKWFIKAGEVVDPNAKMTVTFEVGGKEYKQLIAVNVTENTAPVMLESDNIGIFSLADLNSSKTIVIRPERWFTDPDIGDVMRFVTPVKVKASAYVDAHLDGNNIVLVFKGRGKTQLSFNITDATNELHAHTVTVGCTDIAKLGVWASFIAQIQSNPLLYGIIFGAIFLFILLLIIILIVVHKKRKMRAEIEALLTSESELQEDLFRLSMGGAQYQSFGYLPPAQTINNPSLMLGNPNVAQNNTALQLGAGQGNSPNVQNPDDIVKYPQTGPRANAQQQPPQQFGQQPPPQQFGGGQMQQQPPMNRNPFGAPQQPQQGGFAQQQPQQQMQRPMTPPPPQNPYGVQQNVVAPPQQSPFAQSPRNDPFGHPAEDSFGNPIGGNDGFDPDEF